MWMRGAGLKQTGAVAAALLTLGAAVAASGTPTAGGDSRPNIVVILTDDQSFDTLPSTPPAMPYLQSQIADPEGNWLWFPHAFVNTPLCCPSRASILTGRYSHHTGVRNNGQGALLDESNTLPVWLHEAGYTTALIGKYLNRYSFDRGPYVPPGWDRWVAKRNTLASTAYYDYGFVDQGVPLRVSDAPDTYATDLLADRAVDFLHDAPLDRPFFLYFAPSAPHAPWTPAPRHAGAFEGVGLRVPPSIGERDRSDKPMWVRRLDPLTRLDEARLQERRRLEYETMLGVDDAVRRIVDALGARGDIGRTVIFFLTDNGFSFGEHGIRGKRCPYEECIRTPLAVRVPGQAARHVPSLVSNVDLAPTIADLAGVTPGLEPDGTSFAPALRGRPWRGPPGILLEWAGDREVPPWWGVRTRDFAYVENDDGTLELYDLTGRLGRSDPFEVEGRADDPRYRAVRERLAEMLRTLRFGVGGQG
jgi:arylsulfatase A-like enzyme